MSRDILNQQPNEFVPALDIYNDATNGNLYFTGETVAPGNMEIYLNAQGESDLKDQLTANWFALSVLLSDLLDDTDTCMVYIPSSRLYHYLRVTYNVPAACTVRTSFADGEVIIDDSLRRDSPFDTIWISDDAHYISVDSVQTPGLGVKYEYRYWSDGGARRHQIIVPETSATYTAYFDTFYQVLVNSPYGTPTGEGWYEPGSNVNISVSP